VAHAGRPGHGRGREGGGKEEGRTGNGLPSSISKEGPRREGATAAGKGHLCPVRWRRCRAWRRPELGGKGRGNQGGSVPYLGSGWGAARRGLRGGRRPGGDGNGGGRGARELEGLAAAVRFVVVESSAVGYL